MYEVYDEWPKIAREHYEMDLEPITGRLNELQLQRFIGKNLEDLREDLTFTYPNARIRVLKPLQIHQKVAVVSSLQVICQH